MIKPQSLIATSLIGLSVIAGANNSTPQVTKAPASQEAKPTVVQTIKTPATQEAKPVPTETPAPVKLSSAEIQQKILSSGLNPDAMKRVNKFLYENSGRDFYQDTYACAGKPSESIRPCEEGKRSRSAQKVTVGNPRYIAIIDYSKPSSERRFYFIDRSTGEVGKYYASHGIGSGNGNHAVRFSNRKDSRMTSLGMYLSGKVYDGKYGKTLRLYGLEKSNDQAYNRDIVLHGAWYVGEDFMNTVNPKTKEAYGRLGVSWGCPAVSSYIAWKLMPYLQEGSLVYHYHDKLIDKAQSGQEVALPADQMPVEKTTTNLEANTTKEEFEAAKAKEAKKESESKDSKAAPESKDSKVAQENKDSKSTQEKKESKETPQSKDSKATSQNKDSKATQESTVKKDSQESQAAKDSSKKKG